MKQYILLIFLALGSKMAAAQSGIQPWRKPFRQAEIISYDSSRVVYLSKKKKEKEIPARRLHYVQKDGRNFYPQDYAYFLTGRMLPCRFDHMKDSTRYVFRKRGGGLRTIRKNALLLYTQSGTEKMVFTPFISMYDSVSVAMARAYADGGRDARRFYRNDYGLYLNAAIGLVSGYFLGPYGIIAPAVYTGIESSVRPSLRSKRLLRLTAGRIQSDEEYRRGFTAQVKKRKALFSGIGGAAGFIIGFGVLEYQKSKE